MSGRGRRGFVVRFLLIFLVLAGVLIVRSGALLVVGFVVVGLVVGFVGLTIGLIFTGTGFLLLSFPVTGIDEMCHILHFVECLRYSLLAHDILDALRQAGIVTVTEDRLIPTGTDSETGKLDVVLDDVLIFLHLQVVNAIFCTGRGIDGAELSTEGMDECRLIVDPVRGFVGIQNAWFKVFQRKAAEVGKSKGHFSGVVFIRRISTEIEIAKENEVVELFRIGTVEGVGFLCFGVMYRIFSDLLHRSPAFP